MTYPTYREATDALNILRLARKESSQKFVQASYIEPVRGVFDRLDDNAINDSGALFQQCKDTARCMFIGVWQKACKTT